MITAQEMNNKTKQAELTTANIFWDEFKDRLFKVLSQQAECRCYKLIVGFNDDIGKTNQGCSWIFYYPLREKVKSELENLGYKFFYETDDECVVISW